MAAASTIPSVFHPLWCGAAAWLTTQELSYAHLFSYQPALAFISVVKTALASFRQSRVSRIKKSHHKVVSKSRHKLFNAHFYNLINSNHLLNAKNAACGMCQGH
jgi:hypothetical protein